MSKRYMQRKDNSSGSLETVDEFEFSTRDERQEALHCLREYQISDHAASYYLSTRPCKAWQEGA
jgi:hypothetical protein